MRDEASVALAGLVGGLGPGAGLVGEGDAENHPLAKAIIDEIGEFTKVPLQNIEVIKGQGISADHLLIGNEKLLENHQIFLNAQQKNDLMKLQKHGLSTVLIADDKVRLLYGITDKIRPNVKKTLTRLKKQGIK
ncbi:HAD family hydrolase, partial [Streptomyces sp. NPDC051453]|uniref:HAD family hydrolase n=1 Tax=Streptomyces sp. NPDC051453 TaxID=3154941 RepID=UPI00343806D1